MSSYYNQNPLQILQYLVSVKGYMQQMNEGQREAEDGQPIQSDDLPTDDIVELKENLPETKDYRDEGNNVDAEKSNKPKDVPSEVNDLPTWAQPPMDDPAEQQPTGPYGLRSRAQYKPNGSFDKLKAMFVAGGNMQDRSMYEAKDISSPTVIRE